MNAASELALAFAALFDAVSLGTAEMGPCGPMLRVQQNTQRSIFRRRAVWSDCQNYPGNTTPPVLD